MQRDAGCAPAVLDVSSPLRSDQITGAARKPTLLVPASARTRLSDRTANLPPRRHGSPQPIKVRVPINIFREIRLLYSLVRNTHLAAPTIGARAVSWSGRQAAGAESAGVALKRPFPDLLRTTSSSIRGLCAELTSAIHHRRSYSRMMTFHPLHSYSS